MKKLTFLLLFFISGMYAQEDLLNELDQETEEEFELIIPFKGLKIVNLESTKLAAKGDFYFVIAHRFGSVKGGLDELFGLDQSTIRFSFIWGINDWLNFGASRSSFNKTYDFSLKYKLLDQQDGYPVNITGFNSSAINTLIDEALFGNFEFKHRLTYVHELLVSRQLNEKLSLQLAPILIHENYVNNSMQQNTQFAIGMGGRHKLSNFVTLNLDYVYHTNRADNSPFKNPFSIGFDIETGGHVFQVHFTNAQPMYDAGFITNAGGDWGEGDFFFGFNLSRVF